MIFSASTFALPMRDLKDAFQKLYPETEVSVEFSGSREACYKVTQLKRRADILLLADYLVIEDLLIPGATDWYIEFARNRMAICFTEHSKFGNEINEDNWYRILSRKDVKLGRLNPDLCPLGYRTLMVWQLADIYYKEKVEGKNIYDSLNQNCPSENIRSEEMELLPLLRNFTLDYLFEYLSVAKQQNLKYITLPKEIDLSDPRLNSLYSQAKVTLLGIKKGRIPAVFGSAITYAVTVPNDAPNFELALKFLKFLLSQAGKKIIENNYQEALAPSVANDISKVPSALKEFCRQ